MKKSRKRKSVCVSLAVAGLCAALSGCRPVTREPEAVNQGMGQENGQAENAVQAELEKLRALSPNQLPEELHLEVAEGLEIDARLEISREMTEYAVPGLVLARHLFEQEKCVDLMLEFAGNPGVASREKKEKKDEALENGKEVERDRASLAEGGYVQARDYAFSASIPDRLRLNAAHPENQQDNTLEDAPRNEELAFETFGAVCRKLQALFDRMEIPDLLEPEVFTFTRAYVQEWADRKYREIMENVGSDEEALESAGLEEAAQTYRAELKEEDGYYYIRYRQGYKGIPYYYYGNVQPEVSGSWYSAIPGIVEACYGAEGIAGLSGAVLFDRKEEGEKEGIIPFPDILEKFINENGATPKENKVTVKKIGLAYLPVIKEESLLEFQAMPVWYFLYDAEVSGVGPKRMGCIYDAVTGEVCQ